MTRDGYAPPFALRLLPAGVFLALSLAAAPAFGQATPGRPTPTETALALRQLDGVKRVVMIAAHPDDEDSSLLAALSRGWGAETAYLSLTRGDGGQNVIGPELGEGLGVIRTGELLAARELDGGRQFFTRAYDFGYTKTAAESLAFWNEDEVVADAVWIIRTFRPQVVISQWSGTPRDGHGQHQASGIIARRAFEAAGDPTRFPEQLTNGVEVWKPRKLYLGFRRSSEEPSLRVETGSFDPLLGLSHFQLGMASRSMHRSQDMGVRQLPGPRTSSLELAQGPLPADQDDSFFAGVDTALVSILEGTGGPERAAIERELVAYRGHLEEAWLALSVAEPWRAATGLGHGLERLRTAAAIASELPDPPTELTHVLRSRQAQVEAAMLTAAGIVLEARVEDDLVVPGETVRVQVGLWNGGGLALSASEPSLSVPEGSRVEWAEEEPPLTGRAAFFGRPGGTEYRGPAYVGPGELARWRFDVRIPDDAAPTRQYYLTEPRTGAMYSWPDDRSLWGLPFSPPEITVTARATLALEGALEPTAVAPTVEGRYVGVDGTMGEFRQPVLVVPALSVAVEPPSMFWPVQESGARTVTAVLANESASGSVGTLSLEVPDGWSVSPALHEFALEAPGESRTFEFTVSPAGAVPPGEHVFRAVALTDDGRRYAESTSLIEYPHIDRVALYRPAEARVSAFSARVADGLRVGYIMGSGDSGPTALRQLGVQVDELGPDQVLSGDFTPYDAIVVGVRAYQVRADLAAANDQLLDFGRQGGTLVVQYSQFDFHEGGYAPFPIRIGRDRVSEEDAPVTILDPDAPILDTPNAIGPADFEGWVQERGLYFPAEWDERYRPLLSMADTGEEQLTGSLLVASLGEGVYVYTALSFFRQFPAGVPGAYRLFANLVSLTPADWNAHLAAAESQE